MKFTKLAEPSRNFCFFKMIDLIDPRDGRKKLVLSSFVAGRTGVIVFVDPEKPDVCERYELPGDEGAWALCNYNNEYLLVGTCAKYGYLHCMDLKTRTFREPLRCEGEDYIWDLCVGADGRVYGGTWPGCVLLRYDINAHTLTNLGRVTNDPKNMYSRLVFAAKDKILVNVGFESFHIAAWDVNKETWTDFGAPGCHVKKVYEDGIVIAPYAKPTEYSLHDLTTFEKIEGDLKRPELFKDSRLSDMATPFVYDADGTIYGTNAQTSWFSLKPGDAKPTMHQVTCEAPSTSILELLYDNGSVWGASCLGQTIFRYDIATGTYENTASVCDRGGEVYSMKMIDGKIFMTAYAGGDHIVYDPKAPWNQAENVNPKAFCTLGPDRFIRPNGKSVIGPDGCFWTAWMAPYGSYGGGMSKVDPKTLETTVYNGFIDGLAFNSLVTDGKQFYLATSPSGNGLPVQKDKAMWLITVNTDGKMIAKKELPMGEVVQPFCTAYTDGLLINGCETEITAYDTATLTKQWSLPIPTKAACTFIKAGKAYVFTQSELLILEPKTGKIVSRTALPGAASEHHGEEVHAAVMDEKGTLYFNKGPELFRIDE